MPDLPPGREEELRRLRRWLAFSERLDGLIEAVEPEGEAQPVPEPLPIISAAAESPRGFRAAVAFRLARLALAFHREAAAGTILQPETKSLR